MGSHLSILSEASAMTNMSRETMIGVLLAIPFFLRYFQLYMEHYSNESSSSKFVDSSDTGDTVSSSSRTVLVTPSSSGDDSTMVVEYDEEAPPPQQQQHQVVVVKAKHKSLFTGTIPINTALPPSDQSVSTIPTSNASNEVLKQRQIAAAAEEEEAARLDLELQQQNLHHRATSTTPPDVVTVPDDDKYYMAAITPMKEVQVDLELQQKQEPPLSPLSLPSKQINTSEKASNKSASVVTPTRVTMTTTTTTTFSTPKNFKSSSSKSSKRRTRDRPPMQTISVVTPVTVDSSASASATATTTTTTTTSVGGNDTDEDESIHHHDMSSTAQYLDSISRRLAKKARHSDHSDMVGIAKAMVELGDILMEQEHNHEINNTVSQQEQRNHYLTALKVYKRAEVVQKAIIEDTMASVAAAMAQQSSVLMRQGHLDLADIYRKMATELLASPTPKHLKQSIDLHHDHRDLFMDSNHVHHTSLVRKLDRRLKRASAEAVPLITTLKVQGHIASLLMPLQQAQNDQGKERIIIRNDRKKSTMIPNERMEQEI